MTCRICGIYVARQRDIGACCRAWICFGRARLRLYGMRQTMYCAWNTGTLLNVSPIRHTWLSPSIVLDGVVHGAVSTH